MNRLTLSAWSLDSRLELREEFRRLQRGNEFTNPLACRLKGIDEIARRASAAYASLALQSVQLSLQEPRLTRSRKPAGVNFARESQLRLNCFHEEDQLRNDRGSIEPVETSRVDRFVASSIARFQEIARYKKEILEGKDCRAFKNPFWVKDAIKLRGGIEAIAGEVELEEIQVQTSFWTNVSPDYANIDNTAACSLRGKLVTFEELLLWKVDSSTIFQIVLLCWAIPRWLIILSLKKNTSEQFVSLKCSCRFCKTNVIVGSLQDPFTRFELKIVVLKKYLKSTRNTQTRSKVCEKYRKNRLQDYYQFQKANFACFENLKFKFAFKNCKLHMFLECLVLGHIPSDPNLT